jgi:hypothetical protein
MERFSAYEAVAWLRVAIRAIGDPDRGRARYQQ